MRRSVAPCLTTGGTAPFDALYGCAPRSAPRPARKESGTLIAYLYDVGPLGLGKLVSNAPHTFHGKTPGEAPPMDLDPFSTAYDVPAGHHLALVTGTVDPLYIEHNPTGAQLTFSSPESDPCTCRSRCARSDHRLLPGELGALRATAHPAAAFLVRPGPAASGRSMTQTIRPDKGLHTRHALSHHKPYLY